jgi:Mn2+/Fe2+ NRAMP family transporter
VLHSFVALLLVHLGGYRLFEKIMGACIGIMFVVVIITAFALQPSWRDVAAGLFIPTIPEMQSDGLQWTVALIGGVGGTLTVLCYGYWIREEGRMGVQWIPYCRIDLAVGYTMTAVFGIAMIIIGSEVGEIENQKGASLVVLIADRLQQALGAAGPAARVAFLVGSWGAFFSSLLGVWQSVPYLFADTWSLMQQKDPTAERPPVDVKSFAYQSYLWMIATIPGIGLLLDFKQIQKIYAVVGALCIPMLAIALLYLNGRTDLVGKRHKNTWITRLLLAAALIFFVLAGCLEVRNKLFKG